MKSRHWLWFTPALFCFRALALPIPEAVLPAGVGINIHFTRGHDRDLDLIAAAGFKFIRMDFGWAGIERVRGQYDWSAYDELTANLEKRSLSAIYIFDYSNPLYEGSVPSKNPLNGQAQHDTASPQHPDSVTAFAQWAGASAKHFRGRAVLWEIWNEPNIDFWKPKPDATQYAALALATSKAVREADPQATILGPATSGIPMEFLETVFKAGLLGKWNAVSVHPYRNYSKPPETAVADYARLRTLIEKYGTTPAEKALPILSGEWGYASHTKGLSLETQAAFCARQQLVNLLAGVPLSIWYDWKNDGTNPEEREENFGTVTSDLKPKPAYVAIQTLTHELAGYRVERRVKTDSDKDYVLLCTKASGEQKLAAWTLSASNSVALYLTDSLQPLRMTTSDGKSTSVQPGQKALVLDLAPAPVYVSLGAARVK